MRKADIALSYHNGSRGEPMLNVKIHGPYDLNPIARAVESDSGMVGFAEWFRAQIGEFLEGAWSTALELAWEDAIDAAGEVFGEAYGRHSYKDRRVWAAGRSGGWLYVTHLPNVDAWDAVAVARWSRFARIVAGIVADVPYRALDLLAFNDYAAECETFAAAERLAEDIAADAMAEQFGRSPTTGDDDNG